LSNQPGLQHIPGALQTEGLQANDNTVTSKRIPAAIQFASRRSDLAFLVDMTSCILQAKADRFLVNFKSDVVHIVFEEPPWCFLYQRPLSSAFCNTSCSSLTYIQTIRPSADNAVAILFSRLEARI
jgi:hypothetical protein